MAPLGAMSVFHIAGSDGYIKLSQESSFKEASSEHLSMKTEEP